MTVFPDYYSEFKCKASSCKHNCCIGWEIDIDDDTFEKYSTYEGALKQKLTNCIATKPNKHFILAKDERCPFLNEDNLCEIIIECGEDFLCQICSDHPRFRNFFEDRTETGLGLCCEKAAEIILSKKEKTTFNYDSDLQTGFFKIREMIYTILQDRDFSVDERIDNLLFFCSLNSPLDTDIDWKKEYLKLEILNPEWQKLISELNFDNSDENPQLEIPYEQLLMYLVYRHLSPSVEDGMFSERLKFIILSYYVIRSLNKSNSFEELLEIARMYSAEIEYSDQNINTLLNILAEA